jgi:hypothetical protein
VSRLRSFSIRIPVDDLDELRQVATARGVAVSSLLRDWILERLRLEQRLSLPPYLESVRNYIVHDVLEEIPVTVARSMGILSQLDPRNPLLSSLERLDPHAAEDQAEVLAQLLLRWRLAGESRGLMDILEEVRGSIERAEMAVEEPAEASG